MPGKMRADARKLKADAPRGSTGRSNRVSFCTGLEGDAPTLPGIVEEHIGRREFARVDGTAGPRNGILVVRMLWVAL